jgi:hypothetical protein
VPLDDPVTTSLLNTKTYTEYTKVGETVRGLVRYRAKPFGSDNSAVYLDIDPAVGFPVRQEFYSLAGGTEALQYTMEVRNFSTEAADDLFAIPAGYKKVSPAEMDRLIRRR